MSTTSGNPQNKKSGIIVILLLILGIIAYVGYIHIYANIKTYVYNPLPSPITLEVDGKSYTVEKESTLPISLYPGEHTLKYNDKSETFTKKWVNTKLIFQKRTSFLNPTQSAFVIDRVSYSKGSEPLESSSIKIDGKMYLHEGGFLYEFRGIYGEVNYLWSESLPETVWLFGGALGTTYYQAIPANIFIDGKEGIALDSSMPTLPNLQYTY